MNCVNKYDGTISQKTIITVSILNHITQLCTALLRQSPLISSHGAAAVYSPASLKVCHVAVAFRN